MDIRSIANKVRARAKGNTATNRVQAPLFQPRIESIFDAEERRIIGDVRRFTMVSEERLVSIMDAVKYLIAREIPGALVECGVWRGGSILTMIKTLQQLGVDDRDIYLYDTFDGMTEPGSEDTSPFEQPAVKTWRETPAGVRPWDWAFAPDVFDLDLVRETVLGSGYPSQRIHFVPGKVEDTLPAHAPSEIALARLDTDWYESTLHELRHLYPRLPVGGVLIIDDVGHWEGARRAVDEFFSNESRPIFLSRTDYSARIGVKC